VVVLEDRKDVVGRIAAERGILAGALIALEHAPAVVAASHDRRIDLFSAP